MKQFKSFLLFLIALAALLCITLCGGEPVSDSHVDSDTDYVCDACGAELEKPDNTEKTPESVELITNGKANFQIVSAATNSTTASFKKALDGLKKTLKDLDVDVDLVNETESNATECEVIIGAPSYRGNAFEYDIHTLGPKGYIVKLVGSKVLVLGGSEEALIEAIDVFTKEFLGIDKKTKELTTVTVSAKNNVDKTQTEYRVTAIKLDGNDMSGYTIATDTSNTVTKAIAANIQNALYEKSGKWLEIVPLAEADKSIVIKILPNSYEGNGYSVKVENGQLIFECEFPEKFQGQVDNFIAQKISVVQGEINFTHKTHKASVNVRDIYYEDFGAVGNGYTDDFEAIRNTHVYANTWGHTVCGKASSTYYIGKVSSGLYVPVKTDVNWNNCTFIFDDSEIGPQEKSTDGKAILRNIPIFYVLSDYDYGKDASGKLLHRVTLTDEQLSKMTVKVGNTNVGYAPGFAAIIHVYNDSVKHYIRYGVNQNSGSSMQEAILIDKDGNVDPSTPIIWNYDSVSTAYVYSIEDRPISIGNATINNIANTAPNYYTAYQRNISVTRSNTTIYDIDHSLLKEGETRAPYGGIVSVDNAYNIMVKDMLVQCHARRYDADTGALLGTYEFTGGGAIAVTWKNCRQKNFFQPDGTIAYQGLFGTNYCRNLVLEDCFLNSFDAHCGLTNATIRNSTFEHINFIGNGDIIVENLTIYSDGTDAIVHLRSDYGSTWDGNVYIDGVHMKYMKDNPSLSIIKAEYTNWDFGYICYFPRNITVKNITTAKVRPTIESESRTEEDEVVIEENALPLHLCYRLESIKYDISNSLNNYRGTENLYISDCPNVPGWILPNIDMFKDMRVYMDGAEVTNWKNKYGSK